MNNIQNINNAIRISINADHYELKKLKYVFSKISKILDSGEMYFGMFGVFCILNCYF